MRGATAKTVSALTNQGHLAVLEDAGLRVAAGLPELGHATSVDAITGDPDHVSVAPLSGNAWSVERASGRVAEQGDDGISREAAESIADLTDRAQLALGQPVRIGWAVRNERHVITSVRSYAPETAFQDGRWRRVSLLGPDEGPVSPISVDTLDRALRTPLNTTELREMRVENLFARPYRKIPRKSPPEAALDSLRVEPFHRVVRAALSAARATLRTERIKTRSRARNAPEPFDPSRIDRMSGRKLAHMLDVHQFAVSTVLQDLDRSRIATLGLVRTLERVTDDEFGHADYVALARPKPSHARRVIARSGAVADACQSLTLLKPWTMDVATPNYDGTPAALDAFRIEVEDDQRQRQHAMSAIVRQSRPGPRRTLTRTLALMLDRVAVNKGELADELVATQEGFMHMLIACGGRLVADGMIDTPEDASHLTLTELRDALSGEPGAYTSKVVFRREERQRWRHFVAPRTVG